MKWVKTTILLLLAACNSTGKDSNTITGTYVHQFAGEYSKGEDTLTITPYNKKGGTYLIVRKTGFYRIRGGVLQPREYEREEMVAVFDRKTQQLEDTREGRLFSFPATRKELLFGTDRYQKLGN